MDLDEMQFPLEYAYFKEEHLFTIFVFKWNPSTNPKSPSYRNEPIILTAVFPTNGTEKVCNFHEDEPGEDPPNFFFTDHIVPEELSISLSKDKKSVTVSGRVDYMGCSPEVDFREECEIHYKENIRDFCI